LPASLFPSLVGRMGMDFILEVYYRNSRFPSLVGRMGMRYSGMLRILCGKVSISCR